MKVPYVVDNFIKTFNIVRLRLSKLAKSYTKFPGYPQIIGKYVVLDRNEPKGASWDYLELSRKPQLGRGLDEGWR